MNRIALVTLIAAVAAAAPVAAHDGHKHPPAPTTAAPAPAASEHAPGDHAHESPHGGLVATIDKDTHVEVQFGEKALAVWFYDASMKPIALPTDAKATVVVGKDVKKLDLPVGKKPDGTADDHLTGELVVPADQKAAVVIQATLLGKARTARVERKAGAPAASAPANPPAAPAPAATKGTP